MDALRVVHPPGFMIALSSLYEPFLYRSATCISGQGVWQGQGKIQSKEVIAETDGCITIQTDTCRKAIGIKTTLNDPFMQ
jgi:hypothetical protein